MPTSQTIYVDMDDVLCETARGCLEIIERVFGKRVAYEQLTDFDLGNSCELSPRKLLSYTISSIILMNCSSCNL